MYQKEIYTNEQLESAERLVKAIASVPQGKRAAYVRMIEAMMMGAEMAERLICQSDTREEVRP